MTEAEVCAQLQTRVKKLAFRYRRWLLPYMTWEDLYQEGMARVVMEYRKKPGQTLSYYGTAAMWGMTWTLTPSKWKGRREAKIESFEPLKHESMVWPNEVYIITDRIGAAINNLPPKAKEALIDRHVLEHFRDKVDTRSDVVNRAQRLIYAKQKLRKDLKLP